jgi:hypothetical protein
MVELGIYPILQSVYFLDQVCVHALLVALAAQYPLLNLSLPAITAKRLFDDAPYGNLGEDLVQLLSLPLVLVQAAIKHHEEIRAVLPLERGHLLEADVDLLDKALENVELLLVLAHLLLKFLVNLPGDLRVLDLLEHRGAYGPQLLDLLVVLRVQLVCPRLQLPPLLLGLRAISLRVHRLMLMIGLLGSLIPIIVIVFIEHAEDAEEGVADGAEGLGFLLVLEADLELDVVDGRGVPLRGGVQNDRLLGRRGYLG